MVTNERTIHERVSQLTRNAMLRGAGLALSVPRLRDYFLDKVLGHLERAYDERERDRARLAQERWFGHRLRPFLHRLINERPAAARAILRFIAAWSADIYKRDEYQRVGAPSPCTVVLEPTDRCNLNCPGCYAKSTETGDDLPFEQLAKIVQAVVDMGVTLLTISGGEPFLRERQDRAITRLARRYTDRGFLVYTNGTLIDEEMAARLGEVGNVFPALSVEGFEHQTDARRGHGIYARNRRTREQLARAGVMAGFSATVTRENCESICTDDFIDLRIEEGDLFGWFFLLQPIGRAPRPDLMVTPDQRALLRETVLRWRAEERPIFVGDFWNDGPLTDGCIAAGKYYFHIYANGDISPCVFAPVSCGNVFDILAGRSEYKDLFDFIHRHPVFRAFREEQTRITDRARPCVLIDHPEAFRRVAQHAGCKPAKNMAAGYLDGEIARAVDLAAAGWSVAVPQLPAYPTEELEEVACRKAAS